MAAVQHKKRRIVISDDESDESESDKALPAKKKRSDAAPASKRAKSDAASLSEPVSAAELLHAGEACKRAVLAEFPEYKPALRSVVLEVSERMTSSGAKTVFDGATLRPRCVRLSLPIFCVRSNLDSSITDVVRHELAHAIAGREAAHGPAWQRVCKRIGGTAALGHRLSCCGEQQQQQQQPVPQRGATAGAVPRRRHKASSRGADSWKAASDSLISQLIRF